ncbi:MULTISPECIES: SDR family oxidoreductase [unclassified Brevibacterium]|uniref:SDR family oxidoreductase n=1 Tax=unclassified Brevibacterium TaxID=2614124 RepID=UPI0010930FD6|nr:SDR family oxidoreductase [Brevibacterium sp. S22]TGD31083.1 SDR family oxidoreductase [Brevibacterium sp. S22]
MKRSGTTRDKVVAVTGGARGIGKAIAARFTAVGARVAIGDRDLAEAEDTAAELGVHAFALDVTDPVSFAGFLRAVRSELGPIDVLVNNAGIMWVGAFDEEPESAVRAQVEVNLLGVINGIRAAAPAMRGAGRGHLITVASAASILPTPGEATYAATKHGVLGYLKAARAEMRGSGVCFTVVMPAVVDTVLAAGTGTGAGPLLHPDDVAAAVVSAVIRPRFEITVPGFIGPVARLAGLLPQTVRDRVFGAIVPDQVAQMRADARVGYEKAAFTTSRAGQGHGRAASAE